MDVTVLGCSGGIGGGSRTTSLLVDADLLIDCGTGVGGLSLDELLKIDHVFLTHSHLDHICLLPLLIDTVCELRGRPLTIYGLEETLRILRAHIFNWLVWPDFSAIPDRNHPLMITHPVNVADVISIGRRKIQVLPASHTVPAVGYCIEAASGEQLAFTGDTCMSDALVDALNQLSALRHLLVETAFPNQHLDLARAAKHLCPFTLDELLTRLKVSPNIFVTHLKPGYVDTIREELLGRPNAKASVKLLENGMLFSL